MGYLDGYASAGYAPAVAVGGNPTSGWDTVPVFGKWRTYGNTPIPGSYVVTCPVRVVAPNQDVIYPAGVVASGSLDTNPANYSLSFNALANDDPDISPNTGWQLTVIVTLTGYNAEKYVIDTHLSSLANATPGVNLRTITPS